MLPQWAAEEQPEPEYGLFVVLSSAIDWVRRRALRGGRVRPVRVRPSAWEMLGVFFGLLDRTAARGDQFLKNLVKLEPFRHGPWPDDVVALFGPSLREVAGLPVLTPAELLAGELNALSLGAGRAAAPPAVLELRVFPEGEDDGHHDHDHDHVASPGELLVEPFAGRVAATLSAPGPWDATRAESLGEALRDADRPGWRFGMPRDVDPEVRERVRGALERYLARTAY